MYWPCTEQAKAIPLTTGCRPTDRLSPSPDFKNCLTIPMQGKFEVQQQRGDSHGPNSLVIIVALIVIWLLGLVLKIGGGLIHILLVVAGIIFILNL